MPNYVPLIRRAAKKYGLDPRILLAQLRQESGLNPNAHSNADAHGIAQFIPSTAKQYGVNLNDGKVGDDIEGAARYMRDNLAKTHGDYRAALSIYNSGRPDAYKDPNFAKGQTYDYVRKIMGAAGGGANGSETRPNANAGTADRVDEHTAGTDNSATRQQLKLGYLDKRGRPGALLELLSGLRGAADIPGSSSSRLLDGPQGGSQAPQGPFKGDTLEELFWQGKGGIDVKDGKRVPQGFVSGHTDHVHVADDNLKNLIRLGRLAESMGLHVGENSHFTGQKATGGHATNSWHYKDRALDVSGDPKLMKRYARKVAARFGIR